MIRVALAVFALSAFASAPASAFQSVRVPVLDRDQADGEAVDDYIEAAGANRLFCTHRDDTVRVYWYSDDRTRTSARFDSGAARRLG